MLIKVNSKWLMADGGGGAKAPTFAFGAVIKYNVHKLEKKHEET